MRRSLLTTLLCMAMMSCAQSTGIIQVGPYTYTLSELRAPVRGGGAEAQRVVLATAKDFCRRQGRELLLLDLRPDGDPDTPYWPTAFDATFQCRQAGNETAHLAGQPVSP